MLASYPLINVKVELFDGSYHQVDSSQIAFELAGILAMQSRGAEGQAVLAGADHEAAGRDADRIRRPGAGRYFQSRRAMIENAEQRGNTQVIDATVPLASMFGYSTILRSLTQGRATLHDGAAQLCPGAGERADGNSGGAEVSRGSS